VFDVIVVGGGPAGLSAALMLGRCRRRVLVCDVGEARNRRSRALHGYLTRDGVPPSTLTDLGRAELSQYGVELRQVGVTDASRSENRFRVALADQREEFANFLLLATGVRDELPLIPGFEDCYGISVVHCPYCDAWEWRDRRFAVLGHGKEAERLALGLRTWTADIVVCSNGARIEPSRRAALLRNGIRIETESIVRLDHDGGALRAVAYTDRTLPRDVLFFTTAQHPQSDLALKLGCALTHHGTVKTGSLCTTNVPNVFVAGDASRDVQFAVVAAAEGAKAAVAINKAMQRRELVR